MNRKQFELLKFYTWQLQIKTFGQLAEFKALHEATTNNELLNALIKEYNK